MGLQMIQEEEVEMLVEREKKATCVLTQDLECGQIAHTRAKSMELNYNNVWYYCIYWIHVGRELEHPEDTHRHKDPS